MLPSSSWIAALAVTGTTVVVLAGSVLLLNRLRRWGNLERALAHTVIDAPSRRAFLSGIATLAGVFVVLGATSIFANLGFVPDALNDAVTTSLYCAGAVALLYMIYNGFRVSRLTLADELDLRDFAPDVYGALQAAQPSSQVSEAWLFVTPPVGSGADRPIGGLQSTRR